MRICRITAVTDGYDMFVSDANQDDGVDRIIFSDSPTHDDIQGWNWRPLPHLSLNAKRRTMFVKSNMPFLVPGYDAYVWTDARIQFVTDVADAVEQRLPANFDLMTFRHPRNRNLTEEMREIVREGVLSARTMARYHQQLPRVARQWPVVSETNVIFARNTERYRHMCRRWHWRIENSPPRDQLSFDLACADVALAYEWFDQGVTNASSAEFVTKGKHLSSGNRSRKVDDSLQVLGRDVRCSGKQLSPPISHGGRGSYSTKDISVVVPVHNAANELDTLLKSIATTQFDGQVVLVENGSTDSALEICHEFAVQHPSADITVHSAGAALGFSGACNRGANLASGEIVVFLNSDTIVFSSAWQRLIDRFNANDAVVVGAVGNVAGDCSVGTTQVEAALEAGLSHQAIGKLLSDFCESWSQDVPTQYTRSASGHAFAVRRRDFLDVSGFDAEAFPVGYGEEVDLFMRLAKENGLVSVDPGWYVHHVGRVSFAERTKDLKRDGRRRLARRYGEDKIQRLSNDLRNNPFIQTLNFDVGKFLSTVVLAEFQAIDAELVGLQPPYDEG